MATYKTRTIPTYFEDSAGTERNITVDVWAVNVREVEIESDLPDMPAAELEQVRWRVTDAYWEAEREEYDRQQCALEDAGERYADAP